ncbi:MAG: hypothetical protein H8F28_20990 [Fibrella sp.]|nr:hypothetical protein [Armatimonadota bacterium]
MDRYHGCNGIKQFAVCFSNPEGSKDSFTMYLPELFVWSRGHYAASVEPRATSTSTGATPPLFPSGWQLLQKARQAGMTVSGLFWAQFEDRNWRLFLVVPDGQSTPDIYLWLHSVLPESRETNQSDELLLSPASITVIGPHCHIVQEVRQWANSHKVMGEGFVTEDESLVRNPQPSPCDAYIYYPAPEK